MTYWHEICHLLYSPEIQAFIEIDKKNQFLLAAILADFEKKMPDFMFGTKFAVWG
jgi:hypothetical protein